MAIHFEENGKENRVVVGRVFSAGEAEVLRTMVRRLADGARVEIDFSATAEIHPVALAALVDLAGHGGVVVRTRGLGAAHRRLLGYLGSKVVAPGDSREGSI